MDWYEDRDELEADDAPCSVEDRVRAAIEAADTRRLADRTPAPAWRPPSPESEPQPRAAVSRRDGRRRELPAWITLHIRREAAAAVRRELRSDEKGGLADQLGSVLAKERALTRKLNDLLIARIVALEAVREELDGRLKGLELRSADTAPPVLDLAAERQRRSGGTG